MLDSPVAPIDVLALARLLGARFAERATAHDRDGSFPHENFADLHDAGLLALNGGLAETCRVVSVVGQGCAATGLVLAMQLIQLRSAQSWPATLRARLEHSAIRDGGLANALRVEPALGTPARGGLPATVARRTAAGWSLTGHKSTATGAPALSWLVVWARTDEAKPRTGNFLIPARLPGITLVETWDQAGLRASGSHDMLLQDVAIPADHAIDLRPPAAWSVPDPAAFAWSALAVAALYTGVARAARDWLVSFLRERAPSNLGAPLATLPRMQDALGEVEGCLVANDRMVEAAARACDEGYAPPVTETGLLKTMAAEQAIRAVQRAVAVAGNPGLSRRNPLERHLRDVLCARIHTPQEDAARVAAGRALLEVA